MHEWPEFEIYRERSRDLLRAAQVARLAREARGGQVQRREKSLRDDGGESIRVRWGRVEDEPRIAGLLGLNGVPRWVAFEERFIVAEDDGKLLAALRYRMESKRLLLGLLVVDPWAGERRFARALYAGARELGRELGVGEVLAASPANMNYPGEAGYRRRGRGWCLEAGRPADSTAADDGLRSRAPLLSALAGGLLRRVRWR